MQVVRLRKIGNATIVTLPDSLLEALHLHENDDLAIEIVGDSIVLTRATSDYQDALSAYQIIEPDYRNANRKLAE